MGYLVVDPDGSPGIVYDSAETVREHITFLAQEDPETLADVALGLLAELEKALHGEDN
jgi:hypothetical protein